MTACIFLGPTLPVDDARKIMEATYLPPVRQGDVYRAVLEFRPRVIGIVDGFFHQVPSVWHKEILFAMAEGVHVYGSASMGALRAAELQDFGMNGIGRIFEAFRDGELEDDDEVAVVHAPEEIGFAAASEAMVNIRQTLDAAAAEAIVDPSTKGALENIAKSFFYPHRRYPEILKKGARQGLPEDELAALAAWLDHGRIDQKRDDALAMISSMRQTLERDPPPMSVDYSFEHTTMWDAAIGTMTAERGYDQADGADVWLLDELRLDPRHKDLQRDGLLRALGLNAAERLGLRLDDDDRREAVAAFRLKNNLQRGADLRTWLAARDLDRKDLDRLLDRMLLVDKVNEHLQSEAARLALDALCLGDGYEKMNARATAKRRLFDGVAAGDRQLTDSHEAVTWYFEYWMDTHPPNDLEAFARSRGFKDGADFRRAVVSDYRYRSICNEADSDDP